MERDKKKRTGVVKSVFSNEKQRARSTESDRVTDDNIYEVGIISPGGYHKTSTKKNKRKGNKKEVSMYPRTLDTPTARRDEEFYENFADSIIYDKSVLIWTDEDFNIEIFKCVLSLWQPKMSRHPLQFPDGELDKFGQYRVRCMWYEDNWRPHPKGKYYVPLELTTMIHKRARSQRTTLQALKLFTAQRLEWTDINQVNRNTINEAFKAYTSERHTRPFFLDPNDEFIPFEHDHDHIKHTDDPTWVKYDDLILTSPRLLKSYRRYKFGRIRYQPNDSTYLKDLRLMDYLLFKHNQDIKTQAGGPESFAQSVFGEPTIQEFIKKYAGDMKVSDLMDFVTYAVMAFEGARTWLGLGAVIANIIVRMTKQVPSFEFTKLGTWIARAIKSAPEASSLFAVDIDDIEVQDGTPDLDVSFWQAISEKISGVKMHLPDARKLRDFSMSIVAVKTITGMFIYMKDMLRFYFNAVVRALGFPNWEMKTDLEAVCDRIDELLAVNGEGRTWMWSKRVFSAMDAARKLNLRFIKDPNIRATPAYNRFFTSLSKLEDLGKQVSSSSGVNFEPLAFLFSGTAGKGKTVVAEYIADYVAYTYAIDEVAQAIDKMENKIIDRSKIFTKNLGGEFWDGATNSTQVVVVDEIFQQNVKDKCSEEAVQMLQLVNKSPFYPRMAYLESKNAVVLRPLLVVATTNMELHKGSAANLGIISAEALFRRYHKILIFSEKEFSMAEYLALKGHHISLDMFTQMRFTVQKYSLKKAEYEDILVEVDMPTLLKWVKHSIDARIEKGKAGDSVLMADFDQINGKKAPSPKEKERPDHLGSKIKNYGREKIRRAKYDMERKVEQLQKAVSSLRSHLRPIHSFENDVSYSSGESDSESYEIIVAEDDELISSEETGAHLLVEDGQDSDNDSASEIEKLLEPVPESDDDDPLVGLKELLREEALTQGAEKSASERWNELVKGVDDVAGARMMLFSQLQELKWRRIEKRNAETLSHTAPRMGVDVQVLEYALKMEASYHMENDFHEAIIFCLHPDWRKVLRYYINRFSPYEAYIKTIAELTGGGTAIFEPEEPACCRTTHWLRWAIESLRPTFLWQTSRDALHKGFKKVTQELMDRNWKYIGIGMGIIGALATVTLGVIYYRKRLDQQKKEEQTQSIRERVAAAKEKYLKTVISTLQGAYEKKDPDYRGPRKVTIQAIEDVMAAGKLPSDASELEFFKYVNKFPAFTEMTHVVDEQKKYLVATNKIDWWKLFRKSIWIIGSEVMMFSLGARGEHRAFMYAVDNQGSLITKAFGIGLAGMQYHGVIDDVNAGALSMGMRFGDALVNTVDTDITSYNPSGLPIAEAERSEVVGTQAEIADQNNDQVLISNIMQSVVWLRSNGSLAHAMHIESGWYVCQAHIFSKDLEIRRGGNWSRPTVETFYVLPQRDCVLFKTNLMAKNTMKHFVKDASELKHTALFSIVMTRVADNTYAMERVGTGRLKWEPAVKVNATNPHTYKMYTTIGALVLTGLPNKDGDCGLPWFSKRNGRLVIDGVHIAGRTGATFGVPLTQEILKSYIRTRTQSYTPFDILNPDDKTSHKAYKIPRGTCVLETVKKEYSQGLPRRHGYQKSVFYDESICRVAPAPIAGVMIDGQYQSPLEYQNKKRAGNRITPASSLFAHTDIIIEEWPKGPNMMRSELTLHESINGLTICDENGEFKLNGLYMETSSGSGFSKHATYGKRPHLYWDGDVKKASTVLIEILARMREERAKGVVYHPATWSYKAEILPADKVAQGKIRAFYGGRLDVLVEFGRLYGQWLMAIRSQPGFSENCVGVNPFSKDFHNLFHKLLRGGSNWFDGDWSGYDITIDNSLLEELYRLINKWYEYNYSHVPDFNQAQKLREEFARSDCRPVIHYVVFFLAANGVMSGLRFTAEGNGVIGQIITNVIFFYLAKKEGIDNETICQLWRHARTSIYYGDDNVHAVSDAIKEWFNRQTYAAAAKELFGMTYTTPQKGNELTPFVPKEEISFLKRTFKKVNSIGAPLYLGVMDEMEIWQRLMYVKPTGDQRAIDITRETCVSALIDFSLHGRRVFNQAKEKMNKVLIQAGAPMLTQTFESYSQNFGLLEFEELDTWGVVPVAGREDEETDLGLASSSEPNLMGGLVHEAFVQSRRMSRLTYETSFSSHQVATTVDNVNTAESVTKESEERAPVVTFDKTRDALTGYEDVNEVHVSVNEGKAVTVPFTPFPTINVGDIFNRSYQILEFNWGVQPAGMNLAEIDFPKALLSVPQIASKLGYFTGMRCKGVKLSVRINSTAFQYGRLCVSHVAGLAPGQQFNAGIAAQRRNNYAHFPSACTADTIEKEIDWILPIEYIPVNSINGCPAEYNGYIAKVWIDVFRELRQVGDSLAFIPVTVFASFIEPELIGPVFGSVIRTQSAPQRSSKEADAKSQGSILDDANDWVSTIVKIVEIGEKVAPLVAMLDKPSNTGPTGFMVQDTGRDMVGGAGIDNSTRLSFAPGGESSQESYQFTSGNIKVPIQEFISQPGWFKHVQRDNAQATGLIMKFPVEPYSWQSVSVPGFSTAYLPDYLSWTARMFNYWRGSINYTFMFTASKFSSFRVRITYLPDAFDGADTTNYTGDVYSRVYTIEGDTVISLDVPYLASTAYRLVPFTISEQPLGFSGHTAGILQVEQITPIASASSTNAVSYDIDVFRSGNKDTKFSYFRGTLKVEGNSPQWYSDDVSYEVEEAQTQAALANLKELAEPIHDGKGYTEVGYVRVEEYDSFVSLGMRYCLRQDTLPFSIKTGAKHDISLNQQFETHNMLVLPFRFYRGGTRLRLFKPNDPTNQTTDRIELGLPHTITSNGTNVAYVNQGPNRVAQVEMPFYANVPFVSTTADISTIDEVKNLQLGLTQAFPDKTYFSWADDFGFIGVFAPPVLVTKVTLADKKQNSGIKYGNTKSSPVVKQ